MFFIWDQTLALKETSWKQCSTREKMSLQNVLLFHLRRHVENSGLVLHHGFQTARTERKALTSICFCPYKGIQDSLGSWIPYRGFQTPGTGFQSLSVELWLWIAIVSGIPDFLSCITGSKVYDSGFHKQISQIPDSGYWIPVFVSGPLILDCNLYWDSGFLELYYGFQSPGFRIIRAKRESGFPYISRSVSWWLEPVMKHSPLCLMWYFTTLTIKVHWFQKKKVENDCFLSETLINLFTPNVNWSPVHQLSP